LPETPALRLARITKRFGELVANDAISLDLARGEVLALLGENGAGKSTLVSILFGHYIADEGSIEVDGQPLPPGQPHAALAAGIGMVHQHFTLADNLSVLDNVILGTEPLWQPFSRRRAARAKLVDAARRFGLQVDPDARIGALSVGERQRVEILKALVRGARILILDEPTAVLTPQESESLFATLAQMVAEGLSIIFISHKLDEVLRVSQRVAVLRAGRLVALRPTAGASRAELAEAMVGRSIAPPRRRERSIGAAARALPGTRIAVHAGEVLAIAGVAGNGQRALADALFEDRSEAVARIPEDRHAVGAVGELALWENAVLERYASPAFARRGVMRRNAARAFAQRIVERFDVRGGGLDAPVRALSGGNLQKLILGRALLGAGSVPALIVAEQPTSGLDVGAVAAIHQELLDAAAAGSAVVLISEDLDEIFALADRIAVIHRGAVGAPRPAGDWTLAEIGLAMAGARDAA
jgi:general nucleoside transport system ATP-binding protein